MRSMETDQSVATCETRQQVMNRISREVRSLQGNALLAEGLRAAAHHVERGEFEDAERLIWSVRYMMSRVNQVAEV